jgi:hypothetical protein
MSDLEELRLAVRDRQEELSEAIRRKQAAEAEWEAARARLSEVRVRYWMAQGRLYQADGTWPPGTVTTLSVEDLVPTDE